MEIGDALAARTSELNTEEGALNKRQVALDAAGVKRADKQNAEMKPLEAGVEHMVDTPLPERTPVDMPQPPDLKKLVDPKEYEGLSYALIGMALIGGAVSKGNWLGVSASLNGALKGYHEGNQQKAADAMKEYETKFKAAKDKENQANKEYEDVLKNRNMSINEQLQRIKILAAQHGREDIRAAAEQKSIDTLHKQIDAGRNSMLQVEQRNDAVQKRIEAQRTMHALKVAAAGSGSALDENGAWLAEGALMHGDSSVMKLAMSRFGAKTAVPILNQLGKEMRERGEDPSDLTVARMNVAAQTTALRQATVRLQAVERLTGSIQTLEGVMARLVTKLNGKGIPIANATINAARKALGDQDGDVHEAMTLTSSIGRQYFEAVTMPGSNAQMHAGTQELADKLLNENTPIGALRGVFRGMNAEIGATRDALGKQIKEPGENVRANSAVPPAAKTVHWDDLPK